MPLVSGGNKPSALSSDNSKVPYATLRQELKGMMNRISRIAVSPDSSYVAAGADKGEVRVWSITSSTKTRDDLGFVLSPPSESHGLTSSIAFSLNGTCLGASMGQTVYIWVVRTGQPTAELRHQGFVSSIAFSPDIEHLACADKDIHVWNIESKQRIYTLKGHGNNVHGLSYFSDGTRLASSSYDATLRIWKLADQEKLLQDTWNGHGGKEINCSVISPDGKLLASGADDRQVILWEVETGNWYARPYQGHREVVTSVSFSPDGKHVASASATITGKVHIVDVKSGCLVAELDSGYRRVAYTPDGKYILTLDPKDNRLVRILQLTTPATPPLVDQETSGGRPAKEGATAVIADGPVQQIASNHNQSQNDAMQKQLAEMRTQISVLTDSVAQLKSQVLLLGKSLSTLMAPATVGRYNSGHEDNWPPPSEFQKSMNEF